MMKAAKAFEVGRVRATPVGVWDRVVEIAVHRRLVATREPERQVAATDKIGKGLRRGVAALRRRIGGMDQWAKFGRLGQVGNELRRDQRVGSDHRAVRLRSAIE